jgi:calcineurin-like phosphoesterase family protein
VKIWITADSHWNHFNIIKYCNRPFSDVWEMGIALADAWNLRISNVDIALHLGDITLINNEDKYSNTIDLIRGLKGRKILVRGNHDHNRMIPVYRKWGWKVLDEIIVGDVLMIHVPPSIMPQGIGLVLHGHQHANPPHRANYIDVGVDALPDYAPADLATLVSPERYQAIAERLEQIWSE